MVPKDCALDSTYQFCTSFQRAWSRLCDLQADGSGYCCKRRCRSAFVAVDVGQGFVKAEQSGWLFLSGWLCLVRSGDARRPRPTRHRVGCRRRRSYMTFSYICIHPEEMRLPNTQRWWCLGSDRQWGASTNYVSGKRSCSWSRPPVQQVHTRMHTTHTQQVAGQAKHSSAVTGMPHNTIRLSPRNAQVARRSVSSLEMPFHSSSTCSTLQIIADH